MAIETLRPNAAGDVTTIETQFPAETFHWDKVDEVVADGDTTYVRQFNLRGSEDAYDLYNLVDSAVGEGTINSVTIYIISRGDVNNVGTQTLHIKVKTNGAEHNYDEGTVPNDNTYRSYSEVLAANPETTNAWTWVEIDALQVGPRHVVSAGEINTTQVYVEVDYTPPTNMKMNIGDLFKDIHYIKINIGDVWKDVTEIKINIGDVWKTVFSI